MVLHPPHSLSFLDYGTDRGTGRGSSRLADGGGWPSYSVRRLANGAWMWVNGRRMAVDGRQELVHLTVVCTVALSADIAGAFLGFVSSIGACNRARTAYGSRSR